MATTSRRAPTRQGSRPSGPVRWAVTVVPSGPYSTATTGASRTTRSPSAPASCSAICWAPPAKRSSWAPPVVRMRADIDPPERA